MKRDYSITANQTQNRLVTPLAGPYNPPMPFLSVVIPCFNERGTVAQIIERVHDCAAEAEIVVVDDGSSDGSRDVLRGLEATGLPYLRVLFHDKNSGKGAAVHTGIEAACGEVILIQDADMEYDPRDYPAMLRPIQEGRADVVYGSRFLGGPRRAMMFWHMLANKLLTLMTNILYNTILSDMETGYKVFRAGAIKGVPLRARRFDFEPEVTAKMLKRRHYIYEVPISFYPRDYLEGKKIGLGDAFVAVWTLLKYRFVD